MNNTPFNNHTTEPRDVASSSSNSTGINLPPRKVLPDSKFQRVLHTPLMTGMMILEVIMIKVKRF
jgi:hypothetical protein